MHTGLNVAEYKVGLGLKYCTYVRYQTERNRRPIIRRPTAHSVFALIARIDSAKDSFDSSVSPREFGISLDRSSARLLSVSRELQWPSSVASSAVSVFRPRSALIYCSTVYYHAMLNSSTLMEEGLWARYWLEKKLDIR